MTAIISSVPALNSIVKGVGATFTLDKAQLLLVPSVAGSTYYSDDANWQSVILNYVSSTGNQLEPVLFDATQVSPTALFDVAISALDIFLIESITIMDFQFGTFRVPRSELNAVDFDVDMGVPFAGFEWDTFYNNIASSGSGELHRVGGTEDFDHAAYSNAYPLSGDFTLTFNVACIAATGENTLIGYVRTIPLSVTVNPSTNVDSCIYINTGTYINLYNGAGGSASSAGSVHPYIAGNYTVEIARVSGNITAKFNGVTIFTDFELADIYAFTSIYNLSGSTIISGSLV